MLFFFFHRGPITAVTTQCGLKKRNCISIELFISLLSRRRKDTPDHRLEEIVGHNHSKENHYLESSEVNDNNSISLSKRETVCFHGPFIPTDSDIPQDGKPADSKTSENMEKDTSNAEANIENMYAIVDKTKEKEWGNGNEGEQDEGECIMYENKDLYDTP